MRVVQIGSFSLNLSILIDFCYKNTKKYENEDFFYKKNVAKGENLSFATSLFP